MYDSIFTNSARQVKKQIRFLFHHVIRFPHFVFFCLWIWWSITLRSWAVTDEGELVLIENTVCGTKDRVYAKLSLITPFVPTRLSQVHELLARPLKGLIVHDCSNSTSSRTLPSGWTPQIPVCPSYTFSCTLPSGSPPQRPVCPT